MDKASVKELREKLESRVYTNADELVKAAAEKHTVLNLGSSWPETSFQQLKQDSESDEIYQGCIEEYKEWLGEARKELAVLVKLGLPLTLANMDHAFMKTGPCKTTKKKVSK